MQNPPIKQEQRDDGTVSFAAASAGYLGRMFLRGEGVKQDFSAARMWFERGAEYKDKTRLYTHLPDKYTRISYSRSTEFIKL